MNLKEFGFLLIEHMKLLEMKVLIVYYTFFCQRYKAILLTKGHKLKSEDDEQEILEEGMTRQREEVRREGRSNGVGDLHNEEEEEIVGIQEDVGPNTAENDDPRRS